MCFLLSHIRNYIILSIHFIGEDGFVYSISVLTAGFTWWLQHFSVVTNHHRRQQYQTKQSITLLQSRSSTQKTLSEIQCGQDCISGWQSWGNLVSLAFQPLWSPMCHDSCTIFPSAQSSPSQATPLLLYVSVSTILRTDIKLGKFK